MKVIYICLFLFGCHSSITKPAEHSPDYVNDFPKQCVKYCRDYSDCFEGQYCGAGAGGEKSMCIGIPRSDKLN